MKQERPAETKTNKNGRRAILIIIGIILCLAAAAIAFFWHFYRQTNYVSDDNVQVKEEVLGTELVLSGVTQDEKAKKEETGSLPEEGQDTLSEASSESMDMESPESRTSAEEGMFYDISAVTAPDDAMLKDTYSLLVVGYEKQEDAGGETDLGPSELMVLVTINQKAKKIFIHSFSKDLVADIPERGLHLLSEAFAAGGGPLLTGTLENNYGIAVNHYAAIDFISMAAVVDRFDGIDIQVPEDDLEEVNARITSMCENESLPPKEYLIAEGGWQHLGGIQAIGLARVSAQREVLGALLASIGDRGKAEIIGILQDVFAMVTHNVKPLEILSLGAMLSSSLHDEMVTGKIPYEDLVAEADGVLIPKMPETARRLRERIYQEQEEESES